MKLPIVNNRPKALAVFFFKMRIVAFFCFLFVSSCTKISPESTLKGSWNYVAVTKENKPFFLIDKSDMLLIDTNNNFSYTLRLAQKYGKGTWVFLNPDTLALYYTEPDTVRYFKIRVLTDHRLEFQENDVLFQLDRL